MRKKYLTMYHNWMRSSRMMPDNGLCNIFKNDKLFALIDPEKGRRNTYWGYDGNESCDFEVPKHERYYRFTPMRQNVVLLMAAMNNEL